MKIELKKLKCKRCSYRWIPRQEDVRLCPRCHSSYFDKEKKNGKKNLDKNLH